MVINDKENTMELGLFFEKVQRLLDKGLYIFYDKTGDLTQQDMIGLTAVAVLGLVFCFYGLKLLRIWGALLSFSVGAAGGLYACFYFNLGTDVSWVIGLVTGLILAGLSAWFYRMGAFFVSWGMGTAVILYFVGFTNRLVVFICVGIGFAVALVALKLVAPAVIVLTGLLGGVIVGQTVFRMVPVNIQALHIALPVVLTVLGAVVQFLSESRRRKELHLKKAEEIREANSMENEVDKARSILNNVGSEPFVDNSVVADSGDSHETEGDKDEKIDEGANPKE